MNIELKLQFLKRVLTDTLNDNSFDSFFVNGYPTDDEINNLLQLPISPSRLDGEDCPQRAHTMIGLKRLDNLHMMLNYIRENNIKGDLIETGVWRGGAVIFMKAYIKFYKMDIKVFVCDSFEGLPRPDVDKYPDDHGDLHYTYDNLKVSIEEVKSNFEKYNLLDDKVIFLKGWFSDTLKDNEQIGDISILRFDGDMYGSTMDVLDNLYDKVVDNGVIIIDDYCLPNCKKAITDFRTSHNLSGELDIVDRCGVFWYKNKI